MPWLDGDRWLSGNRDITLDSTIGEGVNIVRAPSSLRGAVFSNDECSLSTEGECPMCPRDGDSTGVDVDVIREEGDRSSAGDLGTAGFAGDDRVAIEVNVPTISSSLLKLRN